MKLPFTELLIIQSVYKIGMWNLVNTKKCYTSWLPSNSQFGKDKEPILGEFGIFLGVAIYVANKLEN